jgi:hypothetical protein
MMKDECPSERRDRWASDYQDVLARKPHWQRRRRKLFRVCCKVVRIVWGRTKVAEHLKEEKMKRTSSEAFEAILKGLSLAEASLRLPGHLSLRVLFQDGKFVGKLGPDDPDRINVWVTKGRITDVPYVG